MKYRRISLAGIENALYTLILHYKSQTPSRSAGFLPAGKTKLMVKDQE
jgi:hypothetical protein